MTTSELFLSEDEIKSFLFEFSQDSDFTYGYTDEEFGISPYITFYIYHQEDEVEVVANKVIDIYEEFENEIIDKSFKLRYRDTGVWKNSTKWKPSRKKMIEEMHESYKKYFVYFIAATTGDSDIQSPRWALQSNIRDDGSRYSSLKLSFGDKWFRENKNRWYTFVKECLIKLNPIQAYSGYEIGSTAQFPIISPEFEIAERIFSNYFYGLDIDHPGNMSHTHNNLDGYINSSDLGAGLRTPTWCFLLSPYWIDQLGLSEEQIR
ncbi:hypothetical protein V8941_16025, partial [Acinetobacter soli]